MVPVHVAMEACSPKWPIFGAAGPTKLAKQPMEYPRPHCEHYGCFYSGDLDGFPSLLYQKSLNLSWKLFLCVLILLA